MGNTAGIEKISDLQLKCKMELVKTPGDDTPSQILMTSVSFKYEGGPALLDGMLQACAAGHTIDVEFNTMQLPLPLKVSAVGRMEGVD